jgi:hypothetical protein
MSPQSSELPDAPLSPSSSAALPSSLSASSKPSSIIDIASLITEARNSRSSCGVRRGNCERAVETLGCRVRSRNSWSVREFDEDGVGERGESSLEDPGSDMLEPGCRYCKMEKIKYGMKSRKLFIANQNETTEWRFGP